MTTSSEIVIVGGGVVGASVAYHLAAKGLRDVLVLERETLGSGSTSKNAGGIRLQFSSEPNVRLSQRALAKLHAFQAELGVDPAFHKVGYLFLITEARDVGVFERSLALWQRLGVPARRLTGPEAGKLFPGCRVDDVILATFCPEDGYADPSSIFGGYVAGARRLGVTFRPGATVSAIEVVRGKVAAVEAGGERIPCGTVIDAAGPWASQIAALAGIDLPIRPLRRHIFVTDPVPGFDGEFPMTIEFASGFYCHRESGGVLLGMGDPDDPPGYDTSVNWDFLPKVVECALARVPALERARVKTGWAGLYEDTPDKHPVLGRDATVQGFVHAAGFSGHGLMHAPAAGELIAELLVDGMASLDLSPFRPSRFAEGALVAEHNVI
ncbi:MAG: FAD-binding oxidoreductase [Chloroflexi bacterium]|nr:FAD-binding oxidoreductase [Chloroflexota bacterium]